MTMFESPKTYQRWCAAVCSDYEVVCNGFIKSEYWDYGTFKKLVQEYGTVYLHQCALGRGKKLDDNFERVRRILMETAKDFWLLHPMKEVLDNIFNDEYCKPSKKIPDARLKTMIAGFYLTYTMFRTCPTKRRKPPKIFMDARDLLCHRYFIMCVEESGLENFVKATIRAMMLMLRLDEAFEFCIESRQVGIDPATRLFRNTVNGGLADICAESAAVQSSCSLPSTSGDELCRLFESFNATVTAIQKRIRKSHFALQLLTETVVEPMDTSDQSGSANDETAELDTQHAFSHGHSNNLALVPYLPKGIVSDNRHGTATTSGSLTLRSNPLNFSNLSHPKHVGILNSVVSYSAIRDVPSFSIPNILANGIVDRAMMNEARKRRERLMGRQSSSGSNPPPKSRNSKAYMEEGGIFGRKILNEAEAQEDDRSLRDIRHGKSGPLWNFVGTGSFEGSAPPSGDN